MNRLDRLKARAKRQQPPAPPQRVRLIYANGHTEDKRDTHAVRVSYIEAVMECDKALENGREPSGIVRVEYESGEVWDFVESYHYYKTEEGQRELERVIDELAEQFSE